MRDDDDDDTPAARRRREREAANRRHLGLMLVGVAAAGVLILVAVLVFGGRGRLSPDCTHADVFEHLRSKGLLAEMRQYGQDRVILVNAAGSLDGAELFIDHGVQLENAVTLTKFSSAAAAKDYAGMSSQGDRFAWGRFCFRGDRSLVSRIKLAMP